MTAGVEAWPRNPFPPGNTVSISHGIWSKRQVDPAACELAEGLLVNRPDLAGYPETVCSWAVAEARCLLLAEWLTDHLMVDEKGRPAPVLRFVVSFERLAADLRARLGLDPRSEADLVRSRAEAARGSFDLEALREEGRKVRELRGGGG
jgi:hypothetical protein